MFNWFSTKHHKNIPPWLQEYQNLNFKYSSKTPISDLTYVVLDSETSGLQKTDEIVTIGAIKCTSKEIFLNEIIDQKFAGIKTGKSAEIHGELQTSERISQENHLSELIKFVSNHIIVGHNISFDMMMINQLFQSKFNVKLRNKVIDTTALAIRLDPVSYERTVGGKSLLHLDDLCNKYEITIENRHTSLGDAYLTTLLFQRLVSMLKKRGLLTIGELM